MRKRTTKTSPRASSRGAAASRDHEGDHLATLSPDALRAVHGGILKSLHDLNERSKANIHRMNAKAKVDVQKMNERAKTFFTKTVPNILKNVPGPLGAGVRLIDDLAHHRKPKASDFISAIPIV